MATKTYVVSTPQNHLNVTQCLNQYIKNIPYFILYFFVNLDSSYCAHYMLLRPWSFDNLNITVNLHRLHALYISSKCRRNLDISNAF